MTNPADLKNIGLKATLPRLKILEIFNQANSQNELPHHLTADDVYRKLLDENLDIGLATVYRVLTQFEQAGLLSRSNFESGKAVFELNSGTHHDHLVCLDCGLVEEFIDEEIEARQKRIASERGFALQEHALAMYGTCKRPNCPNKKG
ncbi:ferric iron uptake transcriptional regulator [Chitinasiproducens palmae]|uniref:Ferric uptake regulation protein n=1 Tax=Chitinasiproducens palmae TaxID=1770053 RepID=A0A1H2PTE9_9BURK|nr:ferric iron uptake transcriptional regulator [Chitinasiproducens palmae]SDV49523.1 ferric uptake regulator, Fur family [Chitinasiproducens palmae]